MFWTPKPVSVPVIDPTTFDIKKEFRDALSIIKIQGELITILDQEDEKSDEVYCSNAELIDTQRELIAILKNPLSNKSDKIISGLEELVKKQEKIEWLLLEQRNLLTEKELFLRDKLTKIFNG